MKVGLVDVDGRANRFGVRFPNIPLMKLSQWHKAQGDSVEWYEPLTSGELDRVYVAKVFSFSEEYPYFINAKEVVRGGSGYCIDLIEGVEQYIAKRDNALPEEVEHIYPDYSIYGITDTAYGFITRGCPRGCGFCHVGVKEGKRAYKVAELREFWDGQKNINLLDPNITAVKECEDIFDELIGTGANIDFSQGLDIRLMTEAKAMKLKRMKIKQIHFSWDRWEDKDIVLPRFKEFMDIYQGHRGKCQVYVLSNYDTTIEQDLERCYLLRDMGYAPYLTIYNKDSLEKGHPLLDVARYVNNRWVFYSDTCKTFEEYRNNKGVTLEGQLTIEDHY